MNCPRCKEKMESTNSSGIYTHTCLYCNGTWINNNALEILLDKEQNKISKGDLLNSFKSQYDKNTNRSCPNCENEKLLQIYTHNVELDLCQKCNGLFFDEGELKSILPKTHKPSSEAGIGSYVATESLFWVLVMFVSGG